MSFGLMMGHLRQDVVFTLDLEDHTKRYQNSGRYIANTEKWLNFLDELQILGTFFVVAEVARAKPDLVRKISQKGHEIASHSLNHTELTRQESESFLKTETQAKEILEQTIGKAIKGFRAPVFSLTSKTVWALDMLKEMGYVYSSSVIPAKNPLNGFPGASHQPFKWPNGIIEFPCPIVSLGPLAMPYLGGGYLRYLPLSLVKAFISKSSDKILWTYNHPYDLDSDEPFTRFPDASIWTSLLLWKMRNRTLTKIKEILSSGNRRFVDLLDTVYVS